MSISQFFFFLKLGWWCTFGEKFYVLTVVVKADIPGEDVGVIWPLAKAGDVAVVDVLEPVVGPKLEKFKKIEFFFVKWEN